MQLYEGFDERVEEWGGGRKVWYHSSQGKVEGLGVVNGNGGLVDRGRLVSRDRGLVRSGGRGVLGLSGVGHVSNITAVGIIDLVVDCLGAAVGEGHRVGAAGSITVTGLAGVECGTGVVIGNSVVVGVHSGLVIGGLLVGGHVLHGGSVVHGLGNMDDGSVVGSGLSDNNSGLVDGSRSGLVHGSRLVHGGRLVDGSRGGLVHRCSMVHRGGGGVVDGSLVCGDSGGSVDSGHRLLIASVPMHGLGGGVGLAADSSVGRAMGLVHGMAYGGSIAKFDGLVVNLVGAGAAGNKDKS